ncbi:MAG TPA: winged helix-turn-helix domain-containing protein [Burkholderiales bacterium]|nr:winged helix-turn-helix domain-containing protein [Burkholderiales bacterium]
MSDDPAAPDIPGVANLLADPARARMLWALIDGTARPAGELAYAAHVSAQSASAHLAKLVDGGLLAVQAQGRHRYFRLVSDEVAHVIESLAALSQAMRPRVPRKPLPSKSVPVQFLHARTCYDHLAGATAVRVLDAMLKSRWLNAQGRDYRLTALGAARLAELGADLAAARRSRRVFARACVDLTERRPHLGGALGAVLLDLCLERGWVLRTRRSRAVNVTPEGSAALDRLCA